MRIDIRRQRGIVHYQVGGKVGPIVLLKAFEIWGDDLGRNPCIVAELNGLGRVVGIVLKPRDNLSPARTKVVLDYI